MNWFTHRFVYTRTPVGRAEDSLKCDNLCEHVEANRETLHVISYENDSWGREASGMCKACWESAQSEEGNHDVVCHDCKRTVKRSETFAWKWYDFDYRQGDTPLTICNACRNGEAHKDRVARDTHDYEDEMRRYNQVMGHDDMD